MNKKMDTTEQYQVWFEKLTKDREESATTLEKPSMRGIKNSVVEKYSDQAHFIYELLQNANDAKATKSSFQLEADGLYFKHNGKVLFSVSNPDTEDQDKDNNKLGHINSITAIANSNKIESSIGKFGVGFKAVFQYTETPHVYDENFRFKIDRFIVPIKLENDFEGRKKDETVFYFPFNKKEISLEKAYSDILDKLKRLVYPTLFLSHLEEVEWKTKDEIGKYTKKVNEKNIINDIVVENIQLYQQINSEGTEEVLYMLKRSTEDHNIYSVGYFIDDKGKLKAKKMPAFCFFPTKETTNLNFIIHAPFLLTDSRESIKNFENHNQNMVELLACLAADSMMVLKELKLIDDEILDIIPYIDPEDTDESSFFAPFYIEILDKFQTEELLPAKDKTYTRLENAYWAEDRSVLNLFSDEQLSFLFQGKNAKWVFRELVRNKTREDDDLRNYIEKCVDDKTYEIRYLLSKINDKFIEKQPEKWLHQLYEYLSKNNSYWNDVKTKPIFLNQNRKAVAAFEQKGKLFHEILFFSSEIIGEEVNTVNFSLLKNKNSKEFMEKFGIKKPSLKDKIYNQILPLYNTDKDIDTTPHFELFFKFWKEEGRPEDFINLIKDKAFICCKKNESETIFRGEANEIYYPSHELENYFETKPDTWFVDLQGYHDLIIEGKDQQILKEFLLKLGVSEVPRLVQEDILRHGRKDIYGSELKAGTRIIKTSQNIIDGCSEILQDISTKKNAARSLILWQMLNNIKYNVNYRYCSLEGELKGIHRYFYRKENCQAFESMTLTLLKKSKWLLSIHKEFVAPYEISIDELADEYIENSKLEQMLGFKPIVVLSKAEIIAQNFASVEEAELAKSLLDAHKAKQNLDRSTDTNLSNVNDEQQKSSKIERTIKSLEDLKTEFICEQKEIKNESKNHRENIDFNENEVIEKGIEELKKQLEIKKSRANLVDSIKNSKKYSYDWFIAYLQLLITYSEKQDNQKQQSISFQEIKKYKTDNKYFLLCGADHYISSEIENANDFKISLIFGNGKREKITVEGVSKKGQDLLIYCPESLSANILSRFSNIFKVEISFTPVIDLLERLHKTFINPEYVDEWEDIEEAIPQLNYIYGPPGTGKTTLLCDQINQIIDSKPNSKFLVLTPTNKAADVVCKKLHEINPDICSVRLSHPTDPELEELEIYRDVLDEVNMRSIHVIASTIHRLPYFNIQELGFLFEYEWDYVIFDESSMIGLHYMTFALMALSKINSSVNFIVAGDPKQIPPVIQIDDKELESFDFQDENIYKMMKLESFDPKNQKIRELDSINNLATQYRSITYIGQLFSELSYSNLLKHDREINKREAKKLPEKFKNLISSNVSFIDIPLNQDSSIYKVNKLFYSSYHTYCAILISEMIKYFDEVNQDQQWTVGLISPYKAQAILLNKLITAYGISENIKIFSDTVHGFQGDECDIVFFICNPNNYFYSGHEKALLSKEYIYNVAISRAKDYLVILHPYTAIKNNIFINKIAYSYKNNFGNAKILDAHDIEKLLFNDENYIENNSYISGHDNVNIFGLSEMKYFIKSNDTAIDIQLRGMN